MLDQATGLRKLVKKLESERLQKIPIKNLVAIASGKGGVGKTTISVNLGISFKEIGIRILLIDGEPCFGDVEVTLGITGEFILNECTANYLKQHIVFGPNDLEILPFSKISGFDNSSSSRNHENFWIELNKLSDTYNLILVDTASGATHSTLDFLAYSSLIILVSNSEPASFADTYGMIKLLSELGMMNKIVILGNMMKSNNEFREFMTRLNRMTSHFLGEKFCEIGFIPYDYIVNNASRSQTSFLLEHGSSSVSRSVRKLASQILNYSRGIRNESG
jgi:flagellar biosynthesis protein FlhG